MATVLLCLAGARLAFAAVAPVIHRSATAGTSSGTLAGSSMISLPPAATVAPSPADQVAIAAKVTQAAEAVLPSAEVGFEVFDLVAGSVLTSHDADRQFASMSAMIKPTSHSKAAIDPSRRKLLPAAIRSPSSADSNARRDNCTPRGPS